ncbi:MAG: Fic family protein [Moraxellaceae bacterium]|nr:Fic family protein [Moraxellaceae bacterium]
MEIVTTIGWLEPLLPGELLQALLDKCDRLQRETVRLHTLLAPHTRERVGALLRVTSSFYSNLIEGQYTEPLTLAANAPKRSRKQLTDLAYTHMDAQQALERALQIHPDYPWSALFSLGFAQRVHERLFVGASDDDLRLRDGSLMQPGLVRGEHDNRNVRIGTHVAPDCSIVLPMLERMQAFYGAQQDFRRQLLSALAYHHRFAWVHPFPDGNGRTLRLITHLQLQRLGLSSPLWSLSRGLARRQGEYYERLGNADQPRRGDLDGRGQLTQQGLFEFLDFMLDTCLDQVEYMISALGTTALRARLESVLRMEPALVKAGIRPEAARALHILITQGQVSRSDFKVFLGLGERLATDQLSRLVAQGLVDSPTPKSRELYPGLPAWFAQQVFPDLHRRFI